MRVEETIHLLRKEERAWLRREAKQWSRIKMLLNRPSESVFRPKMMSNKEAIIIRLVDGKMGTVETARWEVDRDFLTTH